MSTATPSSRKVLRTGEPQRVERYADARGDLAEVLRRSGYRAAVAAPVTVAGGLWGALAAGTRSDEPLPEGLEQRLCDFADLVAQRLANADALEQLAASRARIVEVGDAERRRLERNLHDGAQQRLVLPGARPADGRRDAGEGPAGRPRGRWPRRRNSSRKGSRSCASWRAASIRPSSPSAVSGRRCRVCSRARRCPSRSPSCRRSGWPARPRRPRTTSSPRRSPTWPSTRRRRT